MKKIGLLSDTHSFIHPKVPEFFANCDEIWHAGDIGDLKTADVLSAIRPLRAVYGNIDDYLVRKTYPQFNIFQVEDVKIVLTHIGGYPGHYNPEVLKILEVEKPHLFVCGHSHILKVMFDRKLNLLHINPGAAGFFGFHNVITFIRFYIDKDQIQNLEIFEAPRKSRSDKI